MHKRIWHTGPAFSCLWALLATFANAADNPRRDALDAKFHAELGKLAEKCQELGLDEQAQQTRSWWIDRDPQRQYAFIPQESDPLAPPPGAGRLVGLWYKHLSRHRQTYAQDLLELAKSYAAANQTARGYQLLHEVLRQNPDHAEARAALGYSKQLGRWRQTGWRPSSRTVRVAHPVFGWAPGRYWRVETAHFQITTNHSVKEAQQLGRQLETLHDVWSQLFFRFWGEPADLAASLEGQRRRPENLTKKHRVVLFPDRQEYLDQLAPAVAGIEVSRGIYMDGHSTSYFYAGDEKAVATWYHEAAHQLFHETRPAVEGVGLKDNFWIIEGIAMYMESLRRCGDYWTVGGFDASRLQYARYRALNHQFYVPLEELTALGRDDLQQDERIRRLYSQSAGLAHFLMDYDGGRYRQATIDYLLLLYSGRQSRNSLAELTGVRYEELDRQYQEFLNVTDEQVARYLSPVEHVPDLALGHTAITDKTLEYLEGGKHLEWLDLAYTQITDEGVRHIADATRIGRLNLEGTQVTDAALATVAGFVTLENLDLSQTSITDDGLQHLASLKNLKSLWLTGTQITDAGLRYLAGLKKLETLDVSGTNVTTSAYNQLKQDLPSLTD